MPKLRDRHFWYLSGILILLIGFSLRFYRSDDLGFYYGHNWEQLNNGLAWLDLVLYLCTHFPELGSLSDKNIAIEEIRAGWDEVVTTDLKHFGLKDYTIAIKANWPVHIFLNILAMLLLGVELKALGWLTAFMGVLCIPVFYYVGKSFADRKLGIVCALFIAVSAFSLVLSRDSYDGQQFVPLFCGLTLVLYLQGIDDETKRKMYFGGAGVWGGLSIGVQAVSIPFIGCLFLYEIIRSVKEGLRENKGSLLAMSAGLLITLVLLEVPYLLVAWILGQNMESLFPGFQSFLSTYLYLTSSVSHEHSIPFSAMAIFGVYFFYETVVNGILFLIGMLVVVKNWRERKSSLLIFLFVVPTLYWVFISQNPPEPRHYISAMFPVLVLFSALGFVKACSFIATRLSDATVAGRKLWLIEVMGGLLIVIFAVRNVIPAYDANTGLKKSAQWLKQRGENRIVKFGSCESSFHWLQYDIHTECPQERGGSSRYIAISPIYSSEQERIFLAQVKKTGVGPVYEVPHLFAQRMYEYRTAQSAFLKSLRYLPVVGEHLERIRLKTIQVNEQRRILLYDLADDKVQSVLIACSSSALAG